MTFLELCQRVRQEAGISGTGPADVANQVGINKKLVDWTQMAWDDIQAKHTDWLWMRGYFSFDTTAGQDNYTYISANIDAGTFRSWDRTSFKCYKTADGVTGEMWMQYMPYQQFRSLYGRGTQPTGTPVLFTVKPDKSLLLHNIPNDTYTISGEYRKAPSQLVNNTDTPDIPEHFHPIIIYRALMFYAAHDEANATFNDASYNYKLWQRRLETDQLPDIEVTASFA